MNQKQRYVVLAGSAVMLAVLVTAVLVFNQRKQEKQSVPQDVVQENGETISKTATDQSGTENDVHTSDDTGKQEAAETPENKNTAGHTGNSENETDATELVEEKKPPQDISTGIPEPTPSEGDAGDSGQSEASPVELPFVPYRAN